MDLRLKRIADSRDRRSFIGGSDARIIMGEDESALLRLWREKRGEVEPEDLSSELLVQLGTVTEELNRYFALSKEEKTRYLDDMIAREQRRRQEWQGRGNGPDGSGPLQPLTTFMTNPAGAAIVNAIGPIRQIVQGNEPSAKQHLVILPGSPDKPGAPAQVQHSQHQGQHRGLLEVQALEE